MSIIVGIVTNNWDFDPTERLFNFFNESFDVALFTFGFLSFLGVIEMEYWTNMGK